jgi:hypothetical protein
MVILWLTVIAGAYPEPNSVKITELSYKAGGMNIVSGVNLPTVRPIQVFATVKNYSGVNITDLAVITARYNSQTNELVEIQLSKIPLISAGGSANVTFELPGGGKITDCITQGCVNTKSYFIKSFFFRASLQNGMTNFNVKIKCQLYSENLIYNAPTNWSFQYHFTIGEKICL